MSTLTINDFKLYPRAAECSFYPDDPELEESFPEEEEAQGVMIQQLWVRGSDTNQQWTLEKLKFNTMGTNL